MLEIAFIRSEKQAVHLNVPKVFWGLEIWNKFILCKCKIIFCCQHSRDKKYKRWYYNEMEKVYQQLNWEKIVLLNHNLS